MQKVNTALTLILLLAVGYLLFDKFSGPKTPDTDDEIPAADIVNLEEEMTIELPGKGKIGYVNLDTLNANYTFLADKLELMRSERKRLESRLENKARKAQERLYSLQESAYSMTPQQLEAAETEMQNAEVEISQMQERMSQELLNLEVDIQTKLNGRINHHLDSINTQYGYDYILAKAIGSGVLVTNDKYDITTEVLNSLNEEYAREQADEKK